MEREHQGKSGNASAQLVFWIIAVGGSLFVLAARIWLGRDIPLWLDETWTAMIVSQPDLGSFWHEVWLDINAPLYYQLMWVWTAIAGNSNLALRAPSMIFTIAAAAVPLFWRLEGLSRDARVAWAALIFLWWPANMLSLDARSYALLFFLSVLQTHGFVALLTQPSARRFNIWCALGALSIATHYFAAAIVAVQALLLLWREPRPTLRNWPAFLWFVPVLGWLAYHAPRVAVYSRPGISWYPPLDQQKAFSLVAYTVGPESTAFVVTVALLSALLLSPLCRSQKATDPSDGDPRPLHLAVLSGGIALAVILAVDAIKPSVTGRYLTVIAPLMLLGLILIARSTRWPHVAFSLFVGLSLSTSISLGTTKGILQSRAMFGFEPEVEHLLRGRPGRVIFTWDSPGTRVLDPASLRKLGEFFFFRAGQTPQIIPVILTAGESPDARLMSESRKGPSAILWIYNRRNGSSYWQAPILSRLDGRRCRDYPKAGFAVLSCESGGSWFQ